MTEVQQFRASNPAGGRIDAKAGVLRGVSVVTAGEAKGHNIWIDEKMLGQVKACADAAPTGVPCKEEHDTDFKSIVGALKNFRIEGQQVKADLNLIRSHQRFNAICEIATLMPQSVGLSIVWSGTREEIGGTTYARCSKLYSVDLVDLPAANPSGLFSAKETLPSIREIGLSVYGPADVERLSRNLGGDDSQIDARLERNLWSDGLSWPGMNTTALTAKYGPQPQPHGRDRAAAAFNQQFTGYKTAWSRNFFKK